MASEKKIFEYFFRKFSLSVAMVTNQNKRLDKINKVGRGLLQKHFCKTFFIVGNKIDKTASHKRFVDLNRERSVDVWFNIFVSASCLCKIG